MPQIGDADVRRLLLQYGVTNPSDAEVSIFTGIDVIGGAATSAIAEYANFKKQETERQKNDPLVAYQTMQEQFAKDSFDQANNLYTQLNDVLTTAPQLFGSLTPDQIQSYLAPLKTSFDTALSTVQGTLASRGISGSSTEANALAQTEKQFQQQVLSTGLDVGQKSKAAKAQAIQDRINQLFQGGLTARGQAGQAAGQRSAQDLSQSNLIASLPYFLRSSGEQEAASTIAASKKRGGSFGDIALGTVTGAVTGGAEGFLVGGPWGAVAGAGIGGAAGGYEASKGTPGAPAVSNSGNALLLESLLGKRPGVNSPNLPSGAPTRAPVEPDLFAQNA